MSLVLPYPSLGTGVVNPTHIEENFTEIADKINGNIDNSDISTSAGIIITKLAARYQHCVVRLTLKGYYDGAAWVGGMDALGIKPESLTPVYNDTKGNWTVNRVCWACSDTGAGTGEVQIQWGYYNAAGAWTSAAGDVLATLPITNGGGGAGLPNQGNSAVTATAMTFDANQRSLGINVTTADATALDSTLDALTVVVHISRAITA